MKLLGDYDRDHRLEALPCASAHAHKFGRPQPRHKLSLECPTILAAALFSSGPWDSIRPCPERTPKLIAG
jgi:hypothetical protein